MRAIIVSDFAIPNGGAAKVAVDSARALAEHGVDVLFVSGTGPSDPALKHPLIEAIGLDLPDVWSLPRLEAARQGVWNLEAARRFEAILQERADAATIVHVHQWTKVFSPSVFAAIRRRRAPAVITLHDFFAVCPNGVYYRFDRHEPCRVKPMSLACISRNCDTRSFPHKLVRVARQIGSDRALARLPFEAIHVSDGALAFASAYLPPGVGHHRVDNPITVVHGPPASLGDTVFFVGRFTREKGVDLVAAAARRARMPCVFIGEGPMSEEITALNPEAEILGWRAHADVLDMLRTRALALVAPSRWPETGPLTVAEARAAGVPVVVSPRAGASEAVENNVDGLIVEPQVDALASALAALGAGNLAARLGCAAHERFWSNPRTPERHAQRLVQVYEAALARNRSASESRLAPGVGLTGQAVPKFRNG